MTRMVLVADHCVLRCSRRRPRRRERALAGRRQVRSFQPACSSSGFPARVADHLLLCCTAEP